jgi:hypothetical protein
MIAKSNKTGIHENTDKKLKTIRPLSKISKNTNNRRGESLSNNRKLMALQDALQDPVIIYEGS